MLSHFERMHTRAKYVTSDFDKPVEEIVTVEYIENGEFHTKIEVVERRPSDVFKGQNACDYSLQAQLAVGADLHDCVLNPSVLKLSDKLTEQYSSLLKSN